MSAVMLESIEGRAAQREDAAWERACEGIIVAFANGVDRWDDENVLALFTDDGVLDRAGQKIAGREALRKWLSERPRNVMTRHVASNIALKRLSANEATGLSYFTFYRAEGATTPASIPGPAGLGEYEDRFRLTSGGWKLAERKIRVVFECRP